MSVNVDSTSVIYMAFFQNVLPGNFPRVLKDEELSSHTPPLLCGGTAPRIEICAFSGAKIYPGKGKIYVRIDNRSFRFVNGKAESLFLQRKNPRKISWTVLFRRMHKKGISEEVAKKRNRRTVKHQRAVVGASWEAIRAKRNQKPEVRAAARAAALRDGKDKKKQEDAKKKSEKAKSATSAARGQPKVSKQQAKGAKVSIANTSR
ncbi:60S ribosomal protein L24 [Podila horticola]|nr:60S ribosomal protein L24 [Podila horticola]